MNITAVIRDVLIIFALTFLSGFVIGLSGARHGQQYLLAIAAGNLLFMVIGFTISGALAKTARFKHLIQVALGVWLLGLLNLVIGSATIAQWAIGIVFILVAMGIGGGLSFLFVKGPKPADESAT
jgi:hypothetical protein